MQPGLYLVHKPVGVTSFSVVRTFMEEIAAAGLTKKLPVCHGGTLDPFAEGLLLLLVGQTTRLMELLHGVPKQYEATVAWGVETDNGDLNGKVVAQGDASALTPARLDAALPPFLGWTEQIPPATSAKKIGGEPAYKKAHRGEEVVLPPSRVFLHEARFLSHDLPRSSRLFLSCRGGYYVRSLARDLGRSVGCGAHVATLTRTAIGPWKDPAPGERVLVQGRGLLPWLKTRVLSDAEADDLAHGRPIPEGEVQPEDWSVPAGFPSPEGPVRGLHRDRLVALLEARDGLLHTTANLRGGL